MLIKWIGSSYLYNHNLQSAMRQASRQCTNDGGGGGDEDNGLTADTQSYGAVGTVEGLAPPPLSPPSPSGRAASARRYPDSLPNPSEPHHLSMLIFPSVWGCTLNCVSSAPVANSFWQQSVTLTSTSCNPTCIQTYSPDRWSVALLDVHSH